MTVDKSSDDDSERARESDIHLLLLHTKYKKTPLLLILILPPELYAIKETYESMADQHMDRVCVYGMTVCVCVCGGAEGSRLQRRRRRRPRGKGPTSAMWLSEKLRSKARMGGMCV